MRIDAPDLLVRLLSLVAYINANGGASIDELATEFGVSTAEIRDNLDLLFVTGTPGIDGYMVDVSIEDDWVTLSNTDGVDVPLRLSALEAQLILFALDQVEMPEVAESVRRKLTTAIHSQASAHVDVNAGTVPDHIRTAVQRAQDNHVAVTIDYYVPSRDELTTRTVSPHAFVRNGQWYLDAYCHDKKAPRSFRVDRIRSIQVTKIPAQTGGERTSKGFDVTLTFDPPAAWLADELGPVSVEYDTHGPGTVTVNLHVYSREWLTQLLLMHGRFVREMTPPEYAAHALKRLE